MQYITFFNQMKLPLVGLGTYKLFDPAIITKAYELGYRHFDTAHMYQNHDIIAKGLKPFHRESYFITSKLSPRQLDEVCDHSTVEKALNLALSELKTEYIDLYLIHAPDRSKPMHEVLHSLEKMQKKGKVRSIGVSNCTIHHLQDFLRQGCTIHANQVEFHPLLNQQDLLTFCRENQIVLISYRTLGKGEIFQDIRLQDIASKYHKSVAQIILRWCLQQNIPVIPKTTHEKRLKENISLFDFSLSKEDMEAIHSYNKNIRYCTGDWTDFDY